MPFGSFGNWNVTSLTAAMACQLAANSGAPYAIARAAGTTTNIWCGAIKNGALTSSSVIPGANSQIAPAVFNVGHDVWVVYSGLGTGVDVFFSRMSNNVWDACKQILGAETNNAVAAGLYDGLPTVIYYGGTSGPGGLFATQNMIDTSNKPGNWSPIVQLACPNSGFQPTSMVTANNVTYVGGYLGSGAAAVQGIIMKLTDSGLVQATNIPFGVQPSGSVGLFTLDNTLWAAFILNFPAPPSVFLSQFSTDGDGTAGTWSPFQRLGPSNALLAGTPSALVDGSLWVAALTSSGSDVAFTSAPIVSS